MAQGLVLCADFARGCDQRDGDLPSRGLWPGRGRDEVQDGPGGHRHHEQLPVWPRRFCLFQGR